MNWSNAIVDNSVSHPDVSTLAERISESMRTRGLSARRASELAGESKGWVQSILDGTSKRPAAESLVALARVLGVHSHWLITGEDVQSAATDALEDAIAADWWLPGPLPPPDVAVAVVRSAREHRAQGGQTGALGASYWRTWLREELQRQTKPTKAVPSRVVTDDADTTRRPRRR